MEHSVTKGGGFWLRAFAAPLLVLLLSGCSLFSSQDQQASEAPAYNANSWKRYIDENCVVYFDGCNQCRRSLGKELAACTKKACVVYQKPRCYQNAVDVESIERRYYDCDGQLTLEYYRGKYEAGDLAKTLNADEVMVKDSAAQRLYELSRVHSNTGEKYSDGITIFWTKDDLAQVQFGAATPWLSCKRR